MALVALRDVRSPPSRQTTGADGVEYNSLALQVARGNGYTWDSGAATSFRAPGFPLALAAVYAVFGEYYPAAYALFCLLGVLTCLLSYLLAGEFFEERDARIAACLTAIYFPLIYYATRHDSENVFIPCFAFSTWLYVRHLRTGSLTDAFGAGVALGWATLTRPFAVLAAPVYVVIQLARPQSTRSRRLTSVFVLAAAFACVLAPWVVRNYQVFGRFVLVATNGGSTFYGGNNDTVLHDPAQLGAWVPTNVLPGRDRIEAEPDEVSHDKMEWKLGIEWVREHAESMPRLLMYKLVRLVLPDLSSPNFKYVVLQGICTTPFLLLFAAGFIAVARQGKYWTAPWIAIHLTLACSVATSLIFYGTPRFRDANGPLLMLYAIAGLQMLRPKRR
jgi:4-amino-4-deoxy-L-arabinose transferase-like glycosyltransferase